MTLKRLYRCPKCGLPMEEVRVNNLVVLRNCPGCRHFYFAETP